MEKITLRVCLIHPHPASPIKGRRFLIHPYLRFPHEGGGALLSMMTTTSLTHRNFFPPRREGLREGDKIEIQPNSITQVTAIDSIRQ